MYIVYSTVSYLMHRMETAKYKMHLWIHYYFILIAENSIR